MKRIENVNVNCRGEWYIIREMWTMQLRYRFYEEFAFFSRDPIN